MSSGQMPPWLQEQIVKMQQAQQNLQAVMLQKQHLELENAETAKALDELEKLGDGEAVFKHAGTVLVKSTKKEMVDELKERQELAKTRATVVAKQEERLKESLKEQEAKITEMMKGGQGQQPAQDPRK